jgi:hypothetical protein
MKNPAFGKKAPYHPWSQETFQKEEKGSAGLSEIEPHKATRQGYCSLFPAASQ